MGAHVRFSSIKIPRSFCFDTFLILLLSIIKCSSKSSGIRFLTPRSMYMYVLLLKLIGSLFCLLQCTIFKKSVSISSSISSTSGLFL